MTITFGIIAFAFILFLLVIPLPIHLVLHMNSIQGTGSFRFTLGKHFLGIECHVNTDGFSIRRLLFNRVESFKKRKSLSNYKESLKRTSKKKAGNKRKHSLFCFIRLFFLRFPSLINSVFRCFHLKQCKVEGVFGVGDPAATGQIYGFFQGIFYLVNRPCDVDLFPEFSKTVVHGSAHMVFNFISAHLLWAALSAGWRFLSFYRKCKKRGG